MIPRDGINGFFFRFAASLAVATLVVVTVVGIAVNFYTPKEEDPVMPELQEVNVISLKDNPDLQRMIREARNQEPEPSRELPEPIQVPEREVQGFVQLEYTVNPDGTVSDVEVVGAAPRGVFEQRALERVRNSMHAPGYRDGEAVARRTTEILEFSVPASELSGER